MRLRNIKNSKQIVDNCKLTIINYLDYKNNYNQLFKNNNPINIEIGMGKGDFIINMALQNPNINFIGIEKYTSVLVRAIEKVKDLELPNLRFINADAINIDNIFNKEINTIYLNFSDPWPKDRHAKRRLTSEIFLSKYDNIFTSTCTIIMKTDNDNLFNYSLESLINHKYKIIEHTTDLTNSSIPNIKTEYETKFIKLNKNINYLKAVK